LIVFVEFRVYRNFSRNFLAGDELPSDDSYWLLVFLGSIKEPPSGERSVAKRHKRINPVFWVLLKGWRWWTPARRRESI